jgi:hypothetical protein
VCLVSNLAIGIWVGAAGPTTTRKSIAMVLLVVLVGAGILCLARAAQLAQVEAATLRSSGVATPGGRTGPDQATNITDEAG